MSIVRNSVRLSCDEKGVAAPGGSLSYNHLNVMESELMRTLQALKERFSPEEMGRPLATQP